MQIIAEGKLYDTDEDQLIASDHYWDGNNWERNGRNSYLYKTEKGNFYLYKTTIWQGEKNTITPLSIDNAKDAFEMLRGDPDIYTDTFGEEPERG